MRTKAKYLLDVNVLLALAWPMHQHHAAAHCWFDKHQPEGWATTAVTQLAFVRLSSNRAFTESAVSPQEAVQLLDLIVALRGHEYWDALAGISESKARWESIQGHRQVTDTYLLALAKLRNAQFATFDKRLTALNDDAVSLLPS